MCGSSSEQEAMEFRQRAPSERLDHPEPFSERLAEREAWWSAFLSFPGCSAAREDIVPGASAYSNAGFISAVRVQLLIESAQTGEAVRSRASIARLSLPSPTTNTAFSLNNPHFWSSLLDFIRNVDGM